MSFDEGIKHGKEKRRKYRGAKAWDCSCRNNGGCSYCEGTRTHNTKRRMSKMQYECEDCYDTGCVCGSDATCDGCCHCVTVEDECKGKCCDRAGEYNGFGSDGPLLFVCLKSCPCHD